MEFAGNLCESLCGFHVKCFPGRFPGDSLNSGLSRREKGFPGEKKDRLGRSEGASSSSEFINQVNGVKGKKLPRKRAAPSAYDVRGLLLLTRL